MNVYAEPVTTSISPSHLLVVGLAAMTVEEFWSHVFLGALVSPKPGGSGELGDAVVSQSHVHPSFWVQGPNEDVAGFNVPVHYVQRVEVPDAISQLEEESVCDGIIQPVWALVKVITKGALRNKTFVTNRMCSYTLL